MVGLFFNLILVLAAAETPCQHDDSTFRCVKYIKNYDGDTLTFDIPNVPAIIGRKINVRVADLDTPEMKGKLPCEKQAARTAQKLIENLLKNAKQVHLENVERDKYFRILATVIVDGRSLKDILMKNNLAYTYHGETKQKLDWCAKLRLPADTKEPLVPFAKKPLE
ncbi:MAG: thermonuclease family protein [Bdellovibrionales bacterium]|nr:thermonuclease family protein [Bdellovibrionales bacterium]